MKIIETLTQNDIINILNGQSVGIFPYIFTDTSEEEMAKELSNGYYLYHSGEKRISPYVEKVINFVNENENVNRTSFEIIGTYLHSMFYNKWSRVKNALILSEYNPLNNYDISDVKSANSTKTTEFDSKNTKTGTNTDNTTYDVTTEDDGNVGTHETTSRTGSINNDVYGFNSSVAVGDSVSASEAETTFTADKNKNTSHNTNTKTGTENKTFGIDEENAKTGSDTETDVIDETITKTGRTESGADLIQKELDLRDKNILFDIIYKDIDSVCALQIY